MYMRKLASYILIIVLVGLIPQVSFACSIKNWPDPTLLKYFDDVRNIVRNITDQVSRQETTGSLQEIQSNAARGLNEIITWDDYYSSFNYYVTFELSTEVPYEIKRDAKIIQREIDGLTRFYKRLINTGRDTIQVSSVCGSTPNCTLSWTAGEVVVQLLKNSHLVDEYWRLSVLWENAKFDKKIELVDANFTTLLNSTYNPTTVESCSSSIEGGFFNRVTTRIKSITASDASWKNGVQNWIDAANMAKELASGAEGTKYREAEKLTLKKELRRQWLNTESSTAILNNLDNYNKNWGFWLDTNPLTSSFNYIKDSITTQYRGFMDTTGLGKTTSEEWDSRPETSIGEIIEKSKEITRTEEIKNRIKEIYDYEIPGASAVDNEAQKIQSRIINLHISLSNASKVLKDTCKSSEKVCSEQASNYGGNCSCDL